MKDPPTRGHMTSSNTHHALDAISSRISLFRSHRKADLGERKKHLFEVLGRSRHIARCCQGRELLNGAFATHSTVTQQHKPVAEARGMVDLVNRHEQRSSTVRVGPECRCDVSRLA